MFLSIPASFVGRVAALPSNILVREIRLLQTYPAKALRDRIAAPQSVERSEKKINGAITALPEDRSPILGRLLVDVVLCALARDSCREHHAMSMRGQHIDELFGLCGRKMLSNFQALNQIESSAETDWRGEVGSMKVAGIDQQATSVDVGSVDSTTDTPAAAQTLSHAPWPHPNSTTLRSGRAEVSLSARLKLAPNCRKRLSRS